MIVYDPLYGKIVIPRYLAELAATPEVRRLSQIRLLNTASPTLASLGEVRRYSHTLGVLHLCESNNLSSFSKEERRALAASVLVHDVGTPPFGHLFEYHLREHSGWSHEKIASSVLYGSAAPENKAHQIFAGRTLEFRKELARANVDVGIVSEILSGKHALSQLLFGKLDFDNIDNVARMSWALGLRPSIESFTALAKAISVDSDGRIILDECQGESLVATWAEVRRRVYEIIVFDGPTVAAQAVLSKAMGDALGTKLLSAEDWYLTDEELVAVLRSDPSAKSAVNEYWGRLPQLVFWVQLRQKLEGFGVSSRQELHERIEAVLDRSLRNNRALGYSFEDRGTFGKRLEFVDPETQHVWKVGSTSQSTILYGFSRSKTQVPHKIRAIAFNQLLADLNVPQELIVRSSFELVQDEGHGQSAFNLTP